MELLVDTLREKQEKLKKLNGEIDYFREMIVRSRYFQNPKILKKMANLIQNKKNLKGEIIELMVKLGGTHPYLDY